MGSARPPAEARAILEAHCQRAGQLARTDPEAVWQWLYLQRVANGLNALRLGNQAEAREFLVGMTKVTLH